MRIGRIDGLTGRRVDGGWQRSIEVMVENRSTPSATDVEVSASGHDWSSDVRLGDMGQGTERPVLLVVPNDAGIADLRITLTYTDDRGERRSVEDRWQTGSDPS